MSAPSRLHYKDGEDDSGGGDMEKKKKTRQEEAWRAKAKRQGEEEIRPMLPSARHRCEGTSVSDMALHRWYSRAMDWGKGMPLKVSDNTPKIFEWASPVENRLFSIPIPFPKLTLDEKTGDLRGLGWYLPVPQTSRKSPSYVFLPNFPTLKAISHSALDRLIHASRGPHTTLLIERCKYLHSPDRRHIILWLNSESGRNSILLWTLRHDGVVFWWQLVLEPLWDDSSSISSVCITGLRQITGDLDDLF